MVDDSVGQILSTLARISDLKDDTMIVYTSDHGDMMGDHGMILKGWIPLSRHSEGPDDHQGARG